MRRFGPLLLLASPALTLICRFTRVILLGGLHYRWGTDTLRTLLSLHARPTLTPPSSPLTLFSARCERPVKIIADLQGAKFRVGMVRDEPVVATEGDQVFFGLSSNSQDWSGPGRITINPTIEQTKLLSAMKVGHIVLLDGGAVQLRVTERASRSTVKTKVIVAGNIYSCRSVHVPELSLECAAITRKDKIDLESLRPLNLDYVALSFVQRAKDIIDLRELLCQNDDDDDDDVDVKKGGDSKAAEGRGGGDVDTKSSVAEEDGPFAPKILAKIERQQALENLDEIAAEAGSFRGGRGGGGFRGVVGWCMLVVCGARWRVVLRGGAWWCVIVWVCSHLSLLPPPPPSSPPPRWHLGGSTRTWHRGRIAEVPVCAKVRPASGERDEDVRDSWVGVDGLE